MADAPLWPSICSAIAAVFSAVAAVTVALIQRRNLVEAARPELIVSEWGKRERVQAGFDELKIGAVRNVGTGPALNLHIFSEADPGLYLAMAQPLQLLPAGESADVKGKVAVWWKNIPGKEGGRHISMTVVLLCWDTRGYRYQTNYNLFMVEDPVTHVVANEIAPGVAIGVRTTYRRSVWSLKLQSRVKRLGKKLWSPVGKVFAGLKRKPPAKQAQGLDPSATGPATQQPTERPAPLRPPPTGPTASQPGGDSAGR